MKLWMQSTGKLQKISLFGLEILISDKVYKPSDDSFLLAEKLTVRDEKFLEMGCGCGLLSLMAAKIGGESRGVATDINPFAVELSIKNAELNGLAGKVEFRVGDLFEPLREEERFDLIIFNPPYLPVEDRFEDWLNKAWNGGCDGLYVINLFIKEADRFLAEKGRIIMILSTLSDYARIIEELKRKSFKVRILGEKNFDFEKILCVEFSR